MYVINSNHSVHFDIDKDLVILENENTIYVNSVLEELLIYKRIQKILNIKYFNRSN